jgi:RNA polymerase sigma-70 factor (ECF subfamily)
MRLRPFRPPEPSPDGERPDVVADALDHLDGLYSAALRLTRDPSAADDLVQDTFVKALRFGNRFKPGTNLRAWLFTILHNTFRNSRRDAGRDPVQVDSEAVEQAPIAVDHGEGPENRLLRAADGALLRAALDALPAAYRQAVWLRDVEEFSYADIAGMLGVPVGTVMSRISRGRKLLFVRLTSRESVGSPGDVPAKT